MLNRFSILLPIIMIFLICNVVIAADGLISDEVDDTEGASHDQPPADVSEAVND